MSLWEKTKAGASNAAAATKRGAKKLGLKSDIDSEKGKILKLKQDFGVAAYDVMLANNPKEVERLYLECNTTIKGHETIIQSKEKQIAELEAEGKGEEKS